MGLALIFICTQAVPWIFQLIDRCANVRRQNAVSVLNCCCASVDVTNIGAEFLQVAAVQNCWVAADGFFLFALTNLLRHNFLRVFYLCFKLISLAEPHWGCLLIKLLHYFLRVFLALAIIARALIPLRQLLQITLSSAICALRSGYASTD